MTTFKQSFNKQSSGARCLASGFQAIIESMKDDSPRTVDVGKRLDWFIRAAGMNYVQFANEVAKREGPDSKVSPQTVTHWRKTGKISRERLPVICEVLGITADVLLGMATPAITARVLEPLALSTGEGSNSVSDAGLLPRSVLDDLPADIAPHVRALIEQIVAKSKARKLSEGDLALLISTVTQLSGRKHD